MAILEQERHVELVSGAAQAFVITSRMVSAVIPDELPHLNAFVMAVADATDPKQDTLARVAMLADLTTLPIGRVAGIATPGPNGVEYLTASATVSYPDLQTANDAAKAFQDRITALVNDWISFRTLFNAPDPAPAFITIPLVDASQLTALINAYAAAKQARYAQQQTKTAADAALTAAQADYTYKQGLVSGIGTLVTDTTKVSSEFGTTVTNFGTLLVAGNTFYSLNPTGSGHAAFLASLTTALTQQGAMTSYLADASTAVTDALAYQSARNADVAASSTALTAAQTNQTTQAALLTQLQATETAALAAVLAVCPNFDKHTIPFVPDTTP